MVFKSESPHLEGHNTVKIKCDPFLLVFFWLFDASWGPILSKRNFKITFCTSCMLMGVYFLRIIHSKTSFDTKHINIFFETLDIA